LASSSELASAASAASAATRSSFPVNALYAAKSKSFSLSLEAARRDVYQQDMSYRMQSDQWLRVNTFFIQLLYMIVNHLKKLIKFGVNFGVNTELNT